MRRQNWGFSQYVAQVAQKWITGQGGREWKTERERESQPRVRSHDGRLRGGPARKRCSPASHRPTWI